VWANPETLGPILRDLARASGPSVQIDWSSITPLQVRKLLAEQFGGKQEAQLTPEEKERFEPELKRRLDEIKAKYEREQVPTFTAKQDRTIAYLESTQRILARLALDPKHWDLAIRAPFAPHVPAEAGKP
jgi:hypothetical protein